MSEPAAAPASAAPLAGKTALVTGAATGIGRAIAGALAAAGANVVINHNHMPAPAGKVLAEITAAGGTAIAAAADVSNRAQYQAMVEQLLAEFSRWDILVNNAAVAITKPFGSITEAEFDLSFAVNVKGVFHGLQLAWQHLAEGGRTITISSSTTALVLPGYAVYDAVISIRSAQEHHDFRDSMLQKRRGRPPPGARGPHRRRPRDRHTCRRSLHGLSRLVKRTRVQVLLI
jgi:3-oxoacyl-[acyl-carrier protein] reductase